MSKPAESVIPPASTRLLTRRGRQPLTGLLQRNMIAKLYLKANDFARGQTMAEYALILAAVAIVVFVGYQTMGTTITTLLGSVDSSL
jgi:Flp pilus assembly pilin Flp